MYEPLTIAFITPILAAEYTSMHQVYLAAEAGKFTETQAMMDKVLHDHPNSTILSHIFQHDFLAAWKIGDLLNFLLMLTSKFPLSLF